MADVFRHGLIGHPVAHSLSPQVHKYFAAQLGFELDYKMFDVPEDAFDDCVHAFFRTGGTGLNITLPYKLNALHFPATLTPRAQLARAVNAMCLDDEGRIEGDNADGAGFIRNLVSNHGIDIASCRVLLLGAGGAARGVLTALATNGCSNITIQNRTRARAESLLEDLTERLTASIADVETPAEQPFDLVINATSAGLSSERPAVDSSAIGAATICCDLIYGPDAQTFLQWAGEQGAAKTIDGWGMLVEQAAICFKRWHGTRPDTAELIANPPQGSGDVD